MNYSGVTESSVRPPLEKVWEFEAGGGIEPTRPIGTQPLIAGNDTIFFGSKDKHIYAFEVSSGKERWRFKMDKKIEFPLLMSNDTLYVVSGDKKIYAIDDIIYIVIL